MAPKAKLVAYHPVHGYKIKPQQDLKTIKRNERERSRVETVNSGFETLRKHIPTAAALKKMSKVNILNEAMEYIQYLRSVLHNPTDVKSEPVLLNFTNTMYEQNMYHQYTQQMQQMYSPQGFQPPLTPTTPTMPHFQYPHSDQGFYSDFSQPAPSLPTPQGMHQSPAWHSPRYPNPNHVHQDPLSPVSKVSSSTDRVSTDVQPVGSDSYKYEDISESSGEEDDILYAIAEWQQV